MAKIKEELFMFTMRMSAIDKNILDELCRNLDMSSSDIMKCAMYEFAVSQKDTLLKGSLKELARLRQMDFKMQVMKEVEHITHRQAFPLEGFRHTLDDYHKKFAPIDVVRRFVTVKIVRLYTIYSTSQRKEFIKYVHKNFLHYYPNERSWIDKQFRNIRSMRKTEKSELLVNSENKNLQIESKDNSIDFAEHINQDGDVDANVLKKLPMPKQKAIKQHLGREKLKQGARLEFYRNKDKYFRSKDETKQ